MSELCLVSKPGRIALCWSILIALSISIGLYLLIQNPVATIFLGMGIWGIVHFVFSGLTAMAGWVVHIAKKL